MLLVKAEIPSCVKRQCSRWLGRQALVSCSEFILKWRNPLFAIYFYGPINVGYFVQLSRGKYLKPVYCSESHLLAKCVFYLLLQATIVRLTPYPMHPAPGVILRGLRRGSAPLEFLYWLSFSEFIGLASKVLWSIYALLYGYWRISYCWLYYISIKLNYHVSIFESMGVVVVGPHPNYGVVVPRAPLVKICRNHHCPAPATSTPTISFSAEILPWERGMDKLLKCLLH